MTTFVQQLDAQGPAVVERISTQIADIACTQENARKLAEALHGGTSVTLTADGKTATFTPTTKLGYGEAYIALSLAAEALRNAGVTGCATPDQWEAVLMGGPLAAAGTSSTTTSRSASATSSSSFPGILSLHSQGQGWGQIAQSTNVQLGQIISNSHASISTSGTSGLTPTGRTSSDKDYSSTSSTSSTGAKDRDDARSKQDADKGKPDDSSTLSPTGRSSIDSTSTSPGSSSSSAKGRDKDKEKDDDEDEDKAPDKSDRYDANSSSASTPGSSSSSSTPSSSSPTTSSPTGPRSNR